MVTMVIKIEIAMPINGAKKMNSTVFTIVSLSTILAHDRSVPCVINPCVMAAPANPPIKVWEDEEGIPYHHVSKFQMIAATKPAKITWSVINSLKTVLLM